MFRLDVTHDLIALFPDASLLAGDAYPLDKLPAVDDGLDTRDGVAYLRAPPESVVVWHALPTSGPALLSFACGAVAVAQLPGPEAVTFRIEARNTSAHESDFRKVFEQQLSFAELPQPAGRQEFAIDLGSKLAGDQGALWTLRFSTTRESDLDGDATASITPNAAGTSATPSWPAWFGPRLQSAGREVAVADHPVALDETLLDLVAAFDDAEIREQSDEAPLSRGRVDPAVGVYVYGGEREAVLARAPSQLVYPLEISESMSFEFSYAMQGPGSSAGEGLREGSGASTDGMQFEIRVDDQVVWSQHLDAELNIEDRGWKRQHLDLSPWAGQRVSLGLATLPGGNPVGDDGLWSQLQVLRQRPVPRLPRGARPNILLVVIDTLRADRFGSDGTRESLTPRLDAHAAGGIVFSDARAVSPWTWPSTASIFTGLTPFAHGVLGEGHTDLPDSLDTLAEIFSRNGYTTGAFVANALISRRNHFDQGFETFVAVPGARARALNQRVEHWLDGREQLALFTYVHYLDPHNPYLPPAGHEPPAAAAPEAGDFNALQRRQLEAAFGERYDVDKLGDLAQILTPQRRAYDAEVAYIDAALGELLDEFETRGLLEDALVVVTSDHGEEFLEHGSRYHAAQLHEESLRIPMWIRGYGASALEPRTIDRPADLCAILPTLCDLSGIPRPVGIQSPALLPEPGPGPWFSSTLNGVESGVTGKTEKLGVRHGDWKLIHTPASNRQQLYQLERDPGEIEDLSDQHPEITASLLEAVLAWRAAQQALQPSGSGNTSPESLHWLRELGYLGDEDG